MRPCTRKSGMELPDTCRSQLSVQGRESAVALLRSRVRDVSAISVSVRPGKLHSCGIDGPSAGAAGDVAAEVMLDRRCSLWVVRISSQRSMLTGNGDTWGCRRAIAHSSLHLQLLCKQRGARPDLRPALVVPNSGLISTVARRAVLLRSRP